MVELAARVNEIKKLAALSEEVRGLERKLDLGGYAEEKRLVQSIGKDSWRLCVDRNRRSACKSVFHPAGEAAPGESDASLVVRTMQGDINACMHSLTGTGFLDTQFPEKLQNIAAGAAKLLLLSQAGAIPNGSR